MAESEAFCLGMHISGAIYDDFCIRSRHSFGGEDYELADSEEGEPFTLIRKSDGAKFEVDLIAEVRNG